MSRNGGWGHRPALPTQGAPGARLGLKSGYSFWYVLRYAHRSHLRSTSWKNKARKRNKKVAITPRPRMRTARATPCYAPRDDHTRPTVPPLLYSRPAFIGMLGQECTAIFLLRLFGFPFSFFPKFLLHFTDMHRYASPMGCVDYLCIRSLQRLRAFASGLL